MSGRQHYFRLGPAVMRTVFLELDIQLHTTRLSTRFVRWYPDSYHESIISLSVAKHKCLLNKSARSLAEQTVTAKPTWPSWGSRRSDPTTADHMPSGSQLARFFVEPRDVDMLGPNARYPSPGVLTL